MFYLPEKYFFLLITSMNQNQYYKLILDTIQIVFLSPIIFKIDSDFTQVYMYIVAITMKTLLFTIMGIYRNRLITIQT